MNVEKISDFMINYHEGMWLDWVSNQKPLALYRLCYAAKLCIAFKDFTCIFMILLSKTV